MITEFTIMYTPAHQRYTELDPGVLYYDPHGQTAAQPATCPGVSSMRITILADDSAIEFPWPFVVLSHHPALPVTVQDVIGAMHTNFHESVTKMEMATLSPAREDRIHHTFWKRCEDHNIAQEDGLRRVDYLGDHYMFRGLEPTSDGRGFMMFFGPPP
jgi:hypothetical protein